MAAVEDVERQIAVAAVVAVEEPAFLLAVERIVRGVEVEHDLLRSAFVRFEEELDEQRLDRCRAVADLVIARRLGRLSSRRFSVDLPAAAGVRRRAASLLTSTASTGSCRSQS
jgi:hypothetical protein